MTDEVLYLQSLVNKLTLKNIDIAAKRTGCQTSCNAQQADFDSQTAFNNQQINNLNAQIDALENPPSE